MAKSIGLVELKSFPIGLETTDIMLKAANVDLLLAAPICPGKYIVIVSGLVGDIRTAVRAGVEAAGVFLVNSHIINNVHDAVPAAITGTSNVTKVQSLGALETMTALTAVVAADTAAKSANIQLIEVRLARGLGGKGTLLFTGEIAAVRSALRTCEEQLGGMGDITSTCAIASPSPKLIESIL